MPALAPANFKNLKIDGNLQDTGHPRAITRYINCRRESPGGKDTNSNGSVVGTQLFWAIPFNLLTKGSPKGFHLAKGSILTRGNKGPALIH